MKKLFTILVCLLVVMTTGCTEDPIVENEQVSLAGHWKLIAYEDNETNTILTQIESDSNSFLNNDVGIIFKNQEDNNLITIYSEMGFQTGYYFQNSDTSVNFDDLFTITYLI